MQIVGLYLPSIHVGESKPSENIKIHHFSLSSETVPEVTTTDSVLINKVSLNTSERATPSVHPGWTHYFGIRTCSRICLVPKLNMHLSILH